MTKQKGISLEPPTTYRFGIDTSPRAWRINKMAHSLTQAQAREEFRADPAGYMDKFSLTEVEKDMIARHDWHALLAYGASRNLLLKVAGVWGISMMRMGAEMRGETLEDFQNRLPPGPTGIRSRDDLD